MKKVIVISLGGSLIIPDKINTEFLERFKEIILKNTKKYKFVVVCGGGKTARSYINGLEKLTYSNKKYLQTLLGISATKFNARFMTYFFGKETNWGIPSDMREVREFLEKNDIVFCGALRYAKKQTSDATAAKLALFFDSEFINLTNVNGLYSKDPKKFKSARFIPEISSKEFYKITKKIEYKPGQNFILDQKAAEIIKRHGITTYILGPDINNLDRLLNKKHFIGTIIY